MKFDKPIPGHWDNAEGTVVANSTIDQPRSELHFAEMSDFMLANAQFMVDRSDPKLIVYQTAARERIRWLSAQLAHANVLLEAVKQQCLIAESDEIIVTEDPHLPAGLFDRLCSHLRGHRS